MSRNLCKWCHINYLLSKLRRLFLHFLVVATYTRFKWQKYAKNKFLKNYFIYCLFLRFNAYYSYIIHLKV